MTKNKFRNLITVVAVILVFVLAGGWIAQSVINRQNQSGTKSKMGSCFILTPQNEENSIMTLSAEAYSSTDDSANLNSAAAFYQGESYTLTATVRSFYSNPNVDWKVEFVDLSTEYATGNNASNYISITETENSNTVIVKCMQPFMEQIRVVAALHNNSNTKAICICDYEQRYVYDIELGEYRFRSDSVIEYVNGKRLPIQKAVIKADLRTAEAKTFFVNEVSTLYTIQSNKYKTGSLNFVIEPTEEFAGEFSNYELKTYSNNSDDSGEFEHFFDAHWAHSENGNYDFIKSLLSYSENTPLYKLKILDAPCGEVVFDLYFSFTLPSDAISIDKNNIKF
mgnify:CR=1 FL=1